MGQLQPPQLEFADRLLRALLDLLGPFVLRQGHTNRGLGGFEIGVTGRLFLGTLQLALGDQLAYLGIGIVDAPEHIILLHKLPFLGVQGYQHARFARRDLHVLNQGDHELVEPLIRDILGVRLFGRLSRHEEYRGKKGCRRIHIDVHSKLPSSSVCGVYRRVVSWMTGAARERAVRTGCASPPIQWPRETTHSRANNVRISLSP